MVTPVSYSGVYVVKPDLFIFRVIMGSCIDAERVLQTVADMRWWVWVDSIGSPRHTFLFECARPHFDITIAEYLSIGEVITV